MSARTDNRMLNSKGHAPIPWLESNPLRRVLEEREKERNEVIELVYSLHESGLKIIPSEVRELLPLKLEK